MAEIKSYTGMKTISMKGRKYKYAYEGSGMVGEVAFDDEKANWRILEGANSGMYGSDDYRAMVISKGIFFIMWHEPSDNITVVLSINEKSETVVAAVVSPGEVEFDTAKFC